ncbi:MAG: hypothetical protein EKK42_09460 [Pseudonocardiaceae bacterium]|nr:MAG: hypothetical protein EKK42_09460 [Pseudonocardiaceae bacterium]
MMAVIMQPDYEPLVWTWGPAEVRRYALAVGAPVDVLRPGDLELVTSDAPVVLPTFATLLADGHSLRYLPLPCVDYDPLDVIHAGHELEVHHPLPSSGAGTSESRIIELGDARSGVLVRRETLSCDAAGRLLTRNVVTSVIRGAAVGRPVSGTSALPPPTGDAATVAVPTFDRQARIYAQTCDDNPLHLDPVAARAGGFERPILHGLCALGMVVHRVIAEFGDGRWADVRGLGVRFVAPVVPGDVMVVHVRREADVLHFETSVGERRVQSHGSIELQPVASHGLPPVAW